MVELACSLTHALAASCEMKWVLSFLCVVGSISLYSRPGGGGGGGARAQLFDDASKTFQNITFDSAVRGSYNSSDCLTDLLNCWEAVKPDMICFRWDYYSTICGVVRDYCAEGYGDQYYYNMRWNMMDGMCYYNSGQMWT